MGEFGVHPERPSAKGRNRFWCSHSTLQVSNVLDVFRGVHWHWLPSNHTSNPGSRKVFGHFPWSRTGLPQKPKQKSGPAREQTPGDRPQAPSSALKKPEKLLHKQLRDLNRVQCGALAQVVAGDDEHEAAVAVDGLVLADAADEGIVFAGGGERGRYVDDGDARRGLQHGASLVRGDFLLKLGVDDHGVPGEHWDADAGAGDAQVWDGEDLARFVAEFLLLVGFFGAVVDEVAGEWQRVEGDRRDVWAELLGLEEGAVEGEFGVALADFGDLVCKRLHTGEAGAGNSLVGGYAHGVKAGGVMECLGHGHDCHGGFHFVYVI